MKKPLIHGGLQRRLILSVMLVFCLPMLLIGAYILSSLNTKLYDNAVTSANALLDGVEQELTHTLSSARATVSLLAADTEVCSFLSRDQQDADIVNLFAEKLSPFTAQARLQYPAFHALRLLHANATIFPIRGALVRLESVTQVTSLMRAGSDRVVVNDIRYSAQGRAYAEGDERNVWYVDYIIPPASYTAPAGVAEMVLDHSVLWASATQAVQDSGLHVLLLEGDTLVSATDSAFAGQITDAHQAGVYRLRGGVLLVRPVGLLGMRLCCAIPASITSLPTPQLLWVLLALSGLAALTWLLVKLICQRQLHGLNALTARIDAISPDGTAWPEPEPKDEVERLSLHFDSMYQRLADAFGREKRLLYDDLTNQLKPHFICNAMDMLRLQAQHYHQDQLAESVLQINQYFRYSMLDSGASVTLAEEIDNALNYLKLVNVMREDKIRFDVSLDAWSEAHASTAMIPKMVLQPLLENSVRHGVKLKKNAYISIGVSYETGCLDVRVADNGMGMEPEILAQLNELLSGRAAGEPGRHVGIVNVSRRLRLIYPNAHTVSIQSAPYQGTTVTLRLKLENKEER